MLTQATLKEYLSYNPITGYFTRIKSPRKFRLGLITGGYDKDGYQSINILGKLYKAHRLVWLYVYGYMPEFIDHKNQEESDNRLSNLRPATKSENNCNAVIHRNNTSGTKGISFDKSRNQWSAYIGHAGKHIHLGRHNTLAIAQQVVSAARIKYHGEYCNHG